MDFGGRGDFGSLAHLGFPEPVVEASPTSDGGWLLRSPLELQAYPPTLLHRLQQHARNLPDHLALSEETADGHLHQLDYAGLWRLVMGISPRLKKLCNGGPLMILSGNSIEHAVLRYAAMAAGIPAAPVSPGYSLATSSFEKLRYVCGICRPGAIFVQNTGPFASALAALENRPAVIAVLDEQGLADINIAEWFSELASQPQVEINLDTIDLASPAQIMFTSGSTGMPKAVVHTHTNLMASLAQGQLGVDDSNGIVEHHDIVSWLPWHHVSGSNGLHLAMCQGYTLYLDRGKPVRGQEQATIDLLRRVSMSFYVNVPLGYDMLIEAMERDAELARRFFTTMRFLIFGGAGITAETFQRYDRLAIQIKGEKVPFISAYGSTETTSSVTMTYFDADASGLIGLPLPGLVIKLVPSHGKFELRVKGPNVTPGYLQGSEGLFDTEGYLKTGDLAEWVDQDDFNKGLRFAGRVAEEFKLRSGTWVAGSRLRSQLIDLCTPLVKEVVVCGLNREYVSALMWPNDQACEQIDAGYDARRPWQSGAVSRFIKQAIRQYNQRNPGSSTSIRRIKLMGDPLSVSMGEISDKGSVNSRRVLETRNDAVNSLYTDEAPETLMIERN